MTEEKDIKYYTFRYHEGVLQIVIKDTEDSIYLESDELQDLIEFLDDNYLL